MTPTKPPKTLFKLPLLLLIAAVLIAFLVLLFPWKSINFLNTQDSNALKQQFSSRLLAEYHQLLNNPQASNPQVLKLAQEMSQQGLWESSTQLLNEKVSRTSLTAREQKQLATVQLKNYLDAYYSATASGEDVSQQHTEVRQHLQYLKNYQGLNRKELQALAKASTEFGLFPQAVEIYYHLADIDPTQQAAWLAEAGRWAKQAGDPVSAAKAFKQASELSQDNGRFNAYTYAWLSAASQAGQKQAVQAFLNASHYQLPESPKDLEALATASLEAGLPESASDLYAHLAKRDIPRAQGWYEKAAHWASETKAYRNASHYLQQADALATTANDHWSIQQRLIDVYVKDKRPQQALTVIQPLIEQHPDNQTLLKKGIGIALLEKDLALAGQWNQKRLIATPNALEALLTQADIETLNDNHLAAIDYIKQAIKQRPEDLKLRERWAYLEETQENYPLALKLWRWMYQKSHDEKHQQQVIRLAQADLSGEGLALLINLSKHQTLPKQTVNDIFYHLTKNKQAQAAETFLSEYLKQHGPNRSLLETLANWYGGRKQYQRSLAIWQQLTRAYGSRTQYTLAQLELHWALKQEKEAYQLWRNHHLSWKHQANHAQLSIMGELAWAHKHHHPALNYYQQLLKATPPSKTAQRTLFYSRIALLHSQLGAQSEALMAVKRGFMETADRDLMLNGLQIAFDQKDAQGFQALLSLAHEQASLFASVPRYWLLQAAFASLNKDYQAALPLYQKVLALNPESKDAKAGIISLQQIAQDARKQAILKQLAAMQTAFDQQHYAQLAKLFSASDAQLEDFASLPHYWLLRAQSNFQQQQFRQAITYYTQLLTLKPNSVAARQGVILSLSQLKDFAQLSQKLAKWAPFAHAHDKLWLNYAQAYQAMKDYQSSIPWFEKARRLQPHNYTVLLAYAESLTQLKRTNQAKQLRQLAATQLQQQLASGKLSAAQQKEALFQYLSLLSNLGTPAQFEQTYAQLDRLTTRTADKNRMNEIALAWALNSNNLPQLKRLLARSDVQRMQKPFWMRLAIALKLKNKRDLANLLKDSDKLSTSDHVSVLIALGRQQQAFEVAKKASQSAATAKDREVARTIALSLANGRVSEFIAAYNSRQVGQLKINEQTLHYKRGMGKDGLPIGLDIKLQKAQLSNNRLPGTKVNEQDVSVGFEWRDTTNQVNARLGVYDNGSDSQPYANLKLQRQLNSRLRAGLEYGYQETPDESSYLRQYGRRDRLKIDLSRQFGENNTAQVSVWKQQFNRTDDGQPLATGTGARAAIVHRQNTLNGQWYSGIQGTLQRNNNTDQLSSDDALPESNQSLELIAGFNHGTPGQGLTDKSQLEYSGSVALGKVWPTGEIKAHVEAAVSKELFNNDELSLGVFYDKGSNDSPEDTGVSLQYRKFLDFPITNK